MTTTYSSLTYPSLNGKTGHIAVSTTSRDTCPASCSFRPKEGWSPQTNSKSPCYADAGYFTRNHWDKVSEGSRGYPAETFIDRVSRLPAGILFRHDIAGDLWHIKDSPGLIDPELTLDLARATTHLRAAWTYTHHDLDGVNGILNKKVILDAQRLKFIINVSTESLSQAIKRKKEGYQVTVVQKSGLKTAFRQDGVQFVQCPATLPDSTTTCETCGGRRGIPLCARVRDVVVIFPAHGTRVRAAEKMCS